MENINGEERGKFLMRREPRKWSVRFYVESFKKLLGFIGNAYTDNYIFFCKKGKPHVHLWTEHEARHLLICKN